MSVSRHHIAQIIAEKTRHITDRQHLAREIAAYLLDERKTAQLESLIRDVMLARAKLGIVEVTVTSAHEINQRILDDIQSVVRAEIQEAKTIIIDTVTDPKVVGGVRLSTADQQLDLSVAAKLNTFKRLTAQERSV